MTAPAAILALILAVAADTGVPPSVAVALAYEESRFDSGARSRLVDGYRSTGLFQLYEKPSNLDVLVFRYWVLYEREDDYHTPFDIRNPSHNTRVALRYLADLHKRHGSWERALWFYNCGNVRRVPKETKDYAKRIINAR